MNYVVRDRDMVWWLRVLPENPSLLSITCIR